MLKQLDHIGIAVYSLDKALIHYRDVLGLRLESIEEVASEKVRVAILFAGPTRVELLEPLSDDSPISKFLEKRGEGIHHLAFLTQHIDDQLTKLKAKGIAVLNDQAKPGAHGCMVGFLHPKASHGVLIELVERAA